MFNLDYSAKNHEADSPQATPRHLMIKSLNDSIINLFQVYVYLLYSIVG